MRSLQDCPTTLPTYRDGYTDGHLDGYANAVADMRIQLLATLTTNDALGSPNKLKANPLSKGHAAESGSFFK